MSNEHKLVKAQDLFDHMLQAIFTVGPDLRIDEVSAFTKQVFGDVPMAGQPVCDFLRLDSLPDIQAATRMKFFLNQIYGTDDLQWELSGPERIHELSYPRTNEQGQTEERALELDYAPIYKDGALVKIMFLVKDVTELHRLQTEVARRERQYNENLARIRQIASMEPGSFNTFVSDAYAVLDGCEQSVADLEDTNRRSAAIESLFRGMNALKGKARLFKLSAVQDIACATEDYFQQVLDSQIWPDSEIGPVMHVRMAEVRSLLGELEKLGRQVFGREQEPPAERALAFLRAPEPFDDWRVDLSSLGGECGDDARVRLLAYATKMRCEAQAHGFVNFASCLEALITELQRLDVLGPQVLPHLQRANSALVNTRSLVGEVENSELWPYFVDEAKVLLRLLAGRIAAPVAGGPTTADEWTEIALFAEAACSFGLWTLANLATEYHRAMTEEGLDARVVLKALHAWLADARNLFEMTSRPERNIDLLGRFHEDAANLMERLKGAPPSQVPSLAMATMACARRYRFRLVQEDFEVLCENSLQDGPGTAEILRQHVQAYESIRREIRDNETAKHLLPVMPVKIGMGEDDVENWLASAHKAGLTHLTNTARSLPIPRRILLLHDVGHFNVLIPAARGSKTGQPVQRVLEGRIADLRDSLRGLRQTAEHAHGDGEDLRSQLQDLEKVVTHLTTTSLGDVLAPVATTAADLAKEQGKALDEVVFEGLDIFLEAEIMQRILEAAVHAVRNAVDHGLEPADERISAGKLPGGRITISALERDGWVDLTIEDDGRGIDTAQIRQVALSRGLIDTQRAAALSPEETYELPFLPGFSTASTIFDISGRGGGMDAIRAIARELGGDARLTSRLGCGSRVTLRFPVPPPIVPAPQTKTSAPISPFGHARAN